MNPTDTLPTRLDSAEDRTRSPFTTQPRLLVADDQPDVLEALRLLLKGEGYVIETAGVAGRRPGARSRRASSTSS